MPEASLAFSGRRVSALSFGLKHGVEADRLASIDGLARLQSPRRFSDSLIVRPAAARL